MLTDPKLILDLAHARTAQLRAEAERHRVAHAAPGERVRRWVLPWRRSRDPAFYAGGVASSMP